MPSKTIMDIIKRTRSTDEGYATVESGMIQACATVYAAVYTQARSMGSSPNNSTQIAQDAVRSFINTMDLNA